VNSTSAVTTAAAAAKQSRSTLSLDIAEWSEKKEEGGGHQQPRFSLPLTSEREREVTRK